MPIPNRRKWFTIFLLFRHTEKGRRTPWLASSPPPPSTHNGSRSVIRCTSVVDPDLNLDGSALAFVDWIRIQKGKNDQQKWRNIMFWSAGCSLVRPKDFFCSFEDVHRGLGIEKIAFYFNKKSLIFFSRKIFNFLYIKTLDLDPDLHWPKMLDPNIRIRIQSQTDSRHCTAPESIAAKKIVTVCNCNNHSGSTSQRWITNDWLCGYKEDKRLIGCKEDERLIVVNYVVVKRLKGWWVVNCVVVKRMKDWLVVNCVVIKRLKDWLVVICVVVRYWKID